MTDFIFEYPFHYLITKPSTSTNGSCSECRVVARLLLHDRDVVCSVRIYLIQMSDK